MSLNWSITQVKDYKEISEDPREAGITQALVFAAMAYDLGRITEKNIDEWLYRQEVSRRCEDYYPMTRDGKYSTFTRAELARRIGLSTNVTTTTRTAFNNKVKFLVERESLHSVKLRDHYNRGPAEKDWPSDDVSKLVDLLAKMEPPAIRKAFALASPAGVFKLEEEEVELEDG